MATSRFQRKRKQAKTREARRRTSGRATVPQPKIRPLPKPAVARPKPKPAPTPPPRSWLTPYGSVLKKVAGAALSAISPALGAAISAAPQPPAGFQEAAQTIDPLKAAVQAALTSISPALGAAISGFRAMPQTGFGGAPQAVDPWRMAAQAGLTSISPALGTAFGSVFPPFQQQQPRQPQRRQNVPITFEGEAGWPSQAMRPEDYMYQAIDYMAQGPEYPPAGPPTPPGYTFPTTAPAEPTPYVPPATPYTPPGGGGGGGGGGGDGGGDGGNGEVPEAASWWGADLFGEGWVYLPTVPGETPTQWQGDGERPVGPGWYFLPSVRHFNQLPPMWRDWLGNVVQSQQANWPDPAIAPVQWMPTAQTFPRAPLYMWEPLAGGAPGGQHAIQPPGTPYVPPQQTILLPPVSEPWPAEQDRGDLVIAW